MRTILETDRLILREFVLDDLPAFYRLVSDPVITRYTGDCAASIEEVARGMDERIFRHYRERGYARWAVILKSTRAIIGFAGLKYLDDLNEVDLGYRFLPGYWGQGLATEAARAVVDYGFRVLKLPRIIGICDLENTASLRVLEKAGLKFEKQTDYAGQAVAWYAIDTPMS